MPESGVEVSIDPSFLGNTFSFNFSTAVMVRVNDTLVAKAPYYLMDSGPDDNTFWLTGLSSWILKKYIQAIAFPILLYCILQAIFQSEK